MTGDPLADLLFVVGLRSEARLLRGRPVLVGCGGLAAALRERPGGVISFGLCGALDRDLAVGQLVLASGVATGAGVVATDASLTQSVRDTVGEAALGLVAGANTVVASVEQKAALRKTTHAIAVDMESHLVAREAEAAGVPFAVLRAVSDGATRSLPHAAVAGFRSDGEPDVAAVLRVLVRRPFELAALLRTAGDAATALASLKVAGDRLVPRNQA